MVSSLDGFVAKKDNSISWFETNSYYDKGIELSREDSEKFLSEIDCYVMGARTYELALELSKTHGWAYGNTPTIVMSHSDLPIDRDNIELYSGDPARLVDERLKPNYKHVWLAGGPMLARDFIRLKLVDEIRLSILPIILGDGVPFFDRIEQEQLLELIDVTAYKNGMVELCYRVKRD